EAGFVLQLREDDAEATAPERIGRDEQALFRREQHQRVGIEAGSRMSDPAQAARLELVARRQRVVHREARAGLAGVAMGEGVDVPGARRLEACRRYRDAAAVALVHRGVATAMVGMKMGVDDAADAPGRGPLVRERGIDERERRRGVLDEARVHHGGRVGIDEQDVVGREPVALDEAHAGRQRVGQAQVRPREYISAMTREASSSAGVPAWTTRTGPLVGASIRRVDQGMRTSLTRSMSAQRHARGVMPAWRMPSASTVVVPKTMNQQVMAIAVAPPTSRSTRTGGRFTSDAMRRLP